MPIDHESLMLECLRLAVSQGLKGAEAREEADRMFTNITGRSLKDIQGRRLQFKELGDKPPKAKVIGADGDIDPKHPFSDYVRE